MLGFGLPQLADHFPGPRSVEYDPERGIAVWLVEAKAVRIEESAWAPLFTAVVEPNDFTARVEEAKQSESAPLPSIDVFWEQFDSPIVLEAAKLVVAEWLAAGRRKRLGPNHVVLEAPGPATSGIRTVVAIYSDGRVLVPFSSYAGQNSGIPVGPLTTETFRSNANSLFGFDGSERQARTASGWLTPDRAAPLLKFCDEVALAYAAAMAERASGAEQAGVADAV